MAPRAPVAESGPRRSQRDVRFSQRVRAIWEVPGDVPSRRLSARAPTTTSNRSHRGHSYRSHGERALVRTQVGETNCDCDNVCNTNTTITAQQKTSQVLSASQRHLGAVGAGGAKSLLFLNYFLSNSLLTYNIHTKRHLVYQQSGFAMDEDQQRQLKFSLENIPAAKLLHYCKKDELVNAVGADTFNDIQQRALADGDKITAKYLKGLLAQNFDFVASLRESALGAEAFDRYAQNYFRMTDPQKHCEARGKSQGNGRSSQGLPSVCGDKA